VSLRTPLPVETEPWPAFKSPCQTADAVRCIKYFARGAVLASRLG
jgi:hypothetical protein